MSTKRISVRIKHHQLPKGPNGRRLCRWCSVEVKPPQRTFCGAPDCLHQYWLRRDPQYLRSQVAKRDKGVCGGCGLDCIGFKDAAWAHPDRKLILAWFRELGAKLHEEPWHADHIIPVSEGGGECGLENMRTLCLWCHKRETRELARRRAAARRAA